MFKITEVKYVHDEFGVSAHVCMCMYICVYICTYGCLIAHAKSRVGCQLIWLQKILYGFEMTYVNHSQR